MASVAVGLRQRSTLTLVLAAALVTKVFAAQGVATVREPIATHDFANMGVSLTVATDPQFDAQITRLVPGWARIASALKPYLVILSNHSPRTIVAYCVLFEITDTAGRIYQSLVHFNYPNAVATNESGQTVLPRGREVRPGEARIVGTKFEIRPDVDNHWLTDYARQQSEKFKDTRKLEIKIDAVIFDDGLLIGEDTSKLQHAFETYVNATQGIYRSIVSRIDQGDSVGDAFQWLTTAARDARAKLRADRDLDAFYYFEAAGEVSDARRNVGDERVHDVFKQAIRATAFVIRRDSSR